MSSKPTIARIVIDITNLRWTDQANIGYFTILRTKLGLMDEVKKDGKGSNNEAVEFHLCTL